MIEVERNGKTTELTADYIWSTIPITALARGLSGRVPAGFETRPRRSSIAR